MLNKEELQKAVEKCKKRIETNQCCADDAAIDGRKETREYYQEENSWLSALVSLAESVLSAKWPEDEKIRPPEIMLTPQQEAYLIGGADNPYHFHSQDRIPTHDTLNALADIATQTTVSSATYRVTSNDDYLLCTATTTITLPKAIGGKEIEVIKLFSGGSVTILPSGTDTIQGTTAMSCTTQYTALRLKAFNTGWYLI